MAARSGFDYRQQPIPLILRSTLLASGTGTFVPIYDGVLASIYLVGGGGSGAWGNSLGGGGGAAGAFVSIVIPLFIGARLEYIVGSGGQLPSLGSVGNNGGSTVFGALIAEGGEGGKLTQARSASSCSQGGALTGIAGGSGGYGNNNDTDDYGKGTIPGGKLDGRQTLYAFNNYINGCGGSSIFGFGADKNYQASGYGSGGRGASYNNQIPTVGRGGCILVLELEGYK